MLASLADPKQYETIKNDLIGTINANLDQMFKKSVAVRLDETDGGGLKLIFSVPFEDALLQSTVCLPNTIINGKHFLNKDK
jgi:hypothetical protein